MNIRNRLTKIESQLPPAGNQVVWDFSNTTDEQLHRLCDLWKTSGEAGVRPYSNQLIKDGFLSYRTGGRKR